VQKLLPQLTQDVLSGRVAASISARKLLETHMGKAQAAINSVAIGK
jgi:hypothetical protein